MTESMSQWAYDAVNILAAIIILSMIVGYAVFLSIIYYKQKKKEADYIKTLTDEEKKTIMNYKINSVYDPFKKEKK